MKKQIKIVKRFKEELKSQIKFFDLVYGINAFFGVFIGIALLMITGLCLHIEGIINFNENNILEFIIVIPLAIFAYWFGTIIGRKIKEKNKTKGEIKR